MKCKQKQSRLTFTIVQFLPLHETAVQKQKNKKNKGRRGSPKA